MVTRKSAREVAAMRVAGRIVAEVLERLGRELRPGITTAQLDAVAEELIRGVGAAPSFKGYRGFPASICVSVDDEVVHGIPGPRRLREGQVVSIDAGAIWEGYHGDGARTFALGEVAGPAHRLIETTRAALRAGIAAARPGNRIGDISAAVEDVARAGGFGIVRQYVGHGIGQRMHEEPQVPNFRQDGKGMELQPGLCLAIEPMLTLGSHEVEVRPDGWTVVTRDGLPAAHFEETIVVTENGPEVLTRC
ncbi:MAG: type I methionyl aminopeptidase [Chloroflexi bacterium GWC2_73_18]|nr:MAG: type I methionyl aminopeptidase [Chloroflexi bacterium GWC2_73_18]